MIRRGIHVVVAIFFLGIGAPAQAQEDLPEGLVKQDAASSGKEDVATSGFVAPTERPTEETKDATELKLSAGGMLSGGNSRSLGTTASGKFRLRRTDNQLSAAVAENYGQAAAGPDEPVRTNTQNVQGKVRYDRFLSSRFAVFGAASALNDRFQSLDLRLNLDPGIALYVLDEPKHQLWTELGYDFQYDVRRQNALDEAELTGEELDKTESRHSGRLFLGYRNDLAKGVLFETGVEYIQAVKDTENWRLNWDVAFQAAIAGSFSVANTLSFRYDNNPLPGIKDTDLTAALTLVYQLL